MEAYPGFSYSPPYIPNNIFSAHSKTRRSYPAGKNRRSTAQVLALPEGGTMEPPPAGTPSTGGSLPKTAGFPAPWTIVSTYHTPFFIKLQSFFFSQPTDFSNFLRSRSICFSCKLICPSLKPGRTPLSKAVQSKKAGAHIPLDMRPENVPSLAAAAAVAVPTAVSIAAAAKNDEQQDDPQAASAAKAIIAAPH